MPPGPTWASEVTACSTHSVLSGSFMARILALFPTLILCNRTDLLDQRGEPVMRVAVAGATGRVGSDTVAALERAGHQTVPVSRAAGVDAYAGTGLDEALRGADALVDATNTAAQDEA